MARHPQKRCLTVYYLLFDLGLNHGAPVNRAYFIRSTVILASLTIFTAVAATASQADTQPVGARPTRGFTPSGSGALGHESGPYLIYNVVTRKCVDVSGAGAGFMGEAVNLYTCLPGSGDNQQFTFESAGERSDGRTLYTIWNTKDGLCLDVPSTGPVSAGSLVSEWHCRPFNSDNQLYRLSLRPDGSYWIVNDVSNLCLGIVGHRTGGDWAWIRLEHCSDNDDHHWRLI